MSRLRPHPSGALIRSHRAHRHTRRRPADRLAKKEITISPQKTPNRSHVVMVVLESNVFHHADADDPIAAFTNVAIILQANFHRQSPAKRCCSREMVMPTTLQP